MATVRRALLPKLREGLAWRVAMAGDKIVEVETEDGGKAYVLQSDLDAQERYERELAAFRQQREPLENLSRLMAQGGDELVFTDQGYLPRSAIEAQEYLATRARLAALSGDELVETDEGYKLRSTIEFEDLSLLASRGGDELVLTGQGYLPRSAIEAQQRLGDTARLMAQADDELVLTDQGYLPRSAIEEQERLATQARLAALSGDELVLLPDGFGILQSDLEALPDASSNRRVSTGTSC